MLQGRPEQEERKNKKFYFLFPPLVVITLPILAKRGSGPLLDFLVPL
jgi:hypothetical protein